MTDIQKIENWTEISRGYYRYAVAANACYELIALQQGAKTGPDYYTLYVTGEWKDKSNTPVFRRECLKSCETLANCLYAASEDLEANQYDEDQPACEVTEEDIQRVKNFVEKDPDDNFHVYPREAQSIVKLVLATYEKLNK